MRKNKKCAAFSGLYILLLCTVCPVGAQAEDSSSLPVKVTGELKGQYTFENDTDLETANEGSTDSELIEAKVKVTGDITDNLSFLTEARGVKNYGEGGSIDPDTGEAAGRDDFLELRQYWLEYKGIASKPLSFRLGRQRIAEQRSLWWNRDLDAARLIYDATLFKGFLAIGQNLTEYRTGVGAFNEDDEDIFRILGETSWQYAAGHFLETRIAYHNDHSEMEGVGDLIAADDRDENDATLYWAGLRLKGSCEDGSKGGYRADFLVVQGDEDAQSSTTGPGSARTVTAITDRDVFGWAVDLGVDVPLPVSYSPVLMLGYAYGSGDDDLTDNDDTNFRQTGLDGNTSRQGGASGSSYNYGSVLRPDLANIHIATLGLTVPVFKFSDVSAMYHYYRLAEEATSLSTSGISADLNGSDTELGHGFDVMLNMNVSKELDLKPGIIDQIGFRTTLGAFQAGEAYGTAEDETAFRGQMELKFKF